MSRIGTRALLNVAAAAVALSTLACVGRWEGPLGPGRAWREIAPILVEFADTAVGPGDLVAVGLKVNAHTPVAGIQGVLHWDPDLLEWAGQVPEAGTAVVARDDDAALGRVPFVSVSYTRGLSRFGVFVFRVVAPGYARTVRPSIAHAVRADLEELDPSFSSGATADSWLPAPSGARRMLWSDWLEFLDPAFERKDPDRVPGPSGVLGDEAAKGAVEAVDVLCLANLSVGSRNVAGCSLGSNRPVMNCLVSDGTINVLDVLVIARDCSASPPPQ